MKSIKKTFISLLVSLTIMVSFISTNIGISQTTHPIFLAVNGGGLGRGNG